METNAPPVATTPATVPNGNCPTLKTTKSGTYVDSFFGAGIYAPLANINDAGYEDAIGIRLKTGYGYLDNIAPYEQMPGTFSLADPIDQDGRTCRHCVYVVSDVSGDHIQIPYIAVSGSLVLESVNQDTGEAKGELKDVVFAEISEIEYYTWAGPIPNGRCLKLSSFPFDTRAVPGGSCNNDPEDCPNAQLQVCTGGKCVNK